ncbi:hypothetical protein V8G54_008027 [Vigna mungo]|uniref:Uncharacterized protein n=1 Tax=Vigna mungo TaxID=3915 RepID=A0AAQ3P307_VIGMU
MSTKKIFSPTFASSSSSSTTFSNYKVSKGFNGLAMLFFAMLVEALLRICFAEITKDCVVSLFGFLEMVDVGFPTLICHNRRCRSLPQVVRVCLIEITDLGGRSPPDIACQSSQVMEWHTTLTKLIALSVSDEVWISPASCIRDKS